MTGESGDEETGRGRLKLDVVQLAAGAMASITAALLGSRLGVNGTIIGAALGSIVGTVASTTYTEFLARTASRVRTVVRSPATPTDPLAGDPSGDLEVTERTPPEPHTVRMHPAHAGTPPVDAGPIDTSPTDAVSADPGRADTARFDHIRLEPEPVSPAGSPPGDLASSGATPGQPPARHAAPMWHPPAKPSDPQTPRRTGRGRRPWRNAAIAVVATFLVVVAGLTAFELLSGRTLSSFTGGGPDNGTSVGELFDPGPEVAPSPALPSPDPTSTTTLTPTPSASTTAPTTPAPSDTTTSPSPTPTATTTSPTPTPTGS